MHFIKINNKFINLDQVSLIESVPNEGTYVHLGPGTEDVSIVLQGEEEAELHRCLSQVLERVGRFTPSA